MGFMISIRRVSTTGIAVLGGRVSSVPSRAGGNAGMRHMISILAIRTSGACIVCGSFPSRAGGNAFLAAQVRSVVGAVLVCRSAQQHLLVGVAVASAGVGCRAIRAVVSRVDALVGLVISEFAVRAVSTTLVGIWGLA